MNQRQRAKLALQKVREIDVQLEREISMYIDQMDKGIAIMRRYVEANGFQWNEDQSVVFNVTTAIGWMGGTIEALREKEGKYKAVFKVAFDIYQHANPNGSNKHGMTGWLITEQQMEALEDALRAFKEVRDNT